MRYLDIFEICWLFDPIIKVWRDSNQTISASLVRTLVIQTEDRSNKHLSPTWDEDWRLESQGRQWSLPERKQAIIFDLEQISSPHVFFWNFRKYLNSLSNLMKDVASKFAICSDVVMIFPMTRATCFHSSSCWSFLSVSSHLSSFLSIVLETFSRTLTILGSTLSTKDGRLVS